MYTKVFRIFAVVLFALLQGVSPLLHAHIGQPHSGGIHMHIGLPASYGESKAQLVQSVRIVDSRAIEVGDTNKKRDAVTLDTPAPFTIARAGVVPLEAAHDEQQLFGHPLPFQQPSRFTLPPAQAPPSRAG